MAGSGTYRRWTLAAKTILGRVTGTFGSRVAGAQRRRRGRSGAAGKQPAEDDNGVGDLYVLQRTFKFKGQAAPDVVGVLQNWRIIVDFMIKRRGD